MKLVCLISFLQLNILYLSAQSISNERVVLHLDRYTYLVGDTIRWKAYLFQKGYPGSASTILYAQLFSTKGECLYYATNPIVQAMAVGNMIIGDSLKTGQYTLRAYTTLQTNFSADNFFYCPITILNAKDSTSVTSFAHEKATDVNTSVCIEDSIMKWSISYLEDSGIVNRLVFPDASKDSFCLSAIFDGDTISTARFTLAGNKQTIFLPTGNLRGRSSVFLQKINSVENLCDQNIDLYPSYNYVDIKADTLCFSPFSVNSWQISISDTLSKANFSISISDADRTGETPVSIFDAFNIPLVGTLCKSHTCRIDSSYLSWNVQALNQKGKPLKNVLIVAILSPSKKDSITPETFTFLTDTAGKFQMKGFFWSDTANMHFQVSGRSEKVKLLFSENKFSRSYTAPAIQQWQVGSDSVKKIIDNPYITRSGFGNAKLLAAVTVTGRKDPREELDHKYATGFFAEPTLFSFDLDEEKTSDLEECLKTKVPGYFRDIRADTPEVNGTPIVFFLDQNLTDFATIRFLSAKQLRYVKVFKGGLGSVADDSYVQWKTKTQSVTMAPVGPGQDNSKKLRAPTNTEPWVVALYSRKGDDLRTGESDLSSVPLPGFTRYLPFREAGQSGMTLYWQPLVLTNTYRVRFRNNAYTKHYRICIQGRNADGKLLYTERTLGE